MLVHTWLMLLHALDSPSLPQSSAWLIDFQRIDSPVSILEVSGIILYIGGAGAGL